HIAGFEIRHQKNIRIACDGGSDMFYRGGVTADRIVECEWSIEDRPGDLVAFGHLAESRSLEGRRDLRADRLDRREDRDFRLYDPERMAKVDGVARDVGFLFEIGEDVDCRVGDEKRLWIGRHIHDEDMADAPLGANSRVGTYDFGHQLVGVQTTFHEHIGFTGTDELDSFGGRGVAMRGIDKGKSADIETCRRGCGADLRRWTDEDRPNDLDLGRLDCCLERALITGMDDRRPHRRQRAAHRDESFILLVFPRLTHGRFPIWQGLDLAVMPPG